MIDIIIGFGLLPLLIFANYVVINLCKLFPKYILGMSGVMIGLDSLLTLGYTFTAKVFVDSINLMIFGVGMSIFIALAHKVIVMMKTFKAMFKDEIGN